MAPQIKITDENECTFSYKSENASPVLSVDSGSSDSCESDSDSDDRCDRDKLAVPGGGVRSASPSNNNVEDGTNDKLTNNSNMSSIKRKILSKKEKKKKKKIRRKKHRLPKAGRGGSSSSSTRMAKIKCLVKQSFVPATICLIQCGWLTYETYNKFSPSSIIGTWKWLVVITIFRLTEVMLAASVAILTRRGFNKL